MAGSAPAHVDVLIVGAGISGISAAWHLQRHCPDRSYAILESRDAIGGTWDLFRYPGIRSDSDMHTLGFSFAPWTGDKAIADGEAIRDYVVDTARGAGIDRHIRFGRRVVAADWSSAAAQWRVTVDGPDGRETLTCGFIDLCAGYYAYDEAYAPAFAGAATFGGQVVHPQFWPDELDWRGKRVVVIGSGATAVTLVPALAKDAAHVTMLQRSPSYIVARPSVDRVGAWLHRRLPTRTAYRLTRWKNVLTSIALYRLAKKRPAQVARRIVAMAGEAVGPGVDPAHFTPGYAPWDQRVCLVPDGDLFSAIRDGRASVVTATIDRFTPDGIRLASGEELPADIVVTATGLVMRVGSGIAFALDGAPLSFAGRMQYKGMMFDGVPNMVSTFGYTNASWTLKADLTARYLCRLLVAMRRRGARVATPKRDGKDVATAPMLDFTSGYVSRAAATLPVQGHRAPWRLHQNYVADLIALRFGPVGREMVFSDPVAAERGDGVTRTAA